MKKIRNKKSKNNFKISKIKIPSLLWGGFTGLLFLILPLWLPNIFKYHAEVQNKFLKLTDSVSNLVNYDQLINSDCNIKSDSREKEYFRYDLIALRNNLMTLVETHRSLGHIVSLKTYCAVHALTSYNNTLQLSNNGICETKRKTTKELDTWNRKILTQIRTNSLQQQGLLQSIGQYFSNANYRGYLPKQCKKLSSANA